MILNTSDLLIPHNPIVTSKGIVHASTSCYQNYECKIILNKNRKEKLTDEQVQQIKAFFELFANAQLEAFQNMSNEKSSNNVQGKQ